MLRIIITSIDPWGVDQLAWVGLAPIRSLVKISWVVGESHLWWIITVSWGVQAWPSFTQSCWKHPTGREIVLLYNIWGWLYPKFSLPSNIVGWPYPRSSLVDRKKTITNTTKHLKWTNLVSKLVEKFAGCWSKCHIHPGLLVYVLPSHLEYRCLICPELASLKLLTLEILVKSYFFVMCHLAV